MRWLVGEEADALHLTEVVESDDPDERVGVLQLARVELLHDLDRVGASEHGQPPHRPVAPVVVPWGPVVLAVHEAHLKYQKQKYSNVYMFFFLLSSSRLKYRDLAELQARNPLAADEVLDLLDELLER